MNFPDKYESRRVVILLSIAILFTAPIEVFHLLLELLHVLFEWTETSLDFMIEIMFDTSLHTTQVVVFYIITAAIFYGIYRLWRGFPDFYSQQRQQLHTFLSEERAGVVVYWQESVINKIKLLAVVSGLIFLLFI